jgi:hypothetical protein
MSKEDESSKGPSIGCTTPLGVLIFGLGLSVFGAALGGGCSARIPLTEANISVAGSVGSKERTRKALPDYLEDKIGSQRGFINSQTTLGIWVAEGIGIVYIGKTPEAPLIDLNIDLSKR